MEAIILEQMIYYITTDENVASSEKLTYDMDHEYSQ